MRKKSAWSGVIAGSASTEVVTPIAAPADCVARLMGMTLLGPHAINLALGVVAVAALLNVMLFEVSAVMRLLTTSLCERPSSLARSLSTSSCNAG